MKIDCGKRDLLTDFRTAKHCVAAMKTVGREKQ